MGSGIMLLLRILGEDGTEQTVFGVSGGGREPNLTRRTGPGDSWVMASAASVIEVVIAEWASVKDGWQFWLFFMHGRGGSWLIMAVFDSGCSV